MSRASWSLIGGPVAALTLWLTVDLVPGEPAVTATAAIALLMAIWWMTEAIPLAVTALIPIVAFPLLGVMDGKTVSTQYANDIIFLFVGGFAVALAMERWHLHQRLALAIMARVGKRPRTILLGFMSACAFLSMWISNTATAMMMIPIALALVNRLEGVLEGIDRYAVGIFLGIAYSASIGGVATLVGTPPNLIFARIYHQTFPAAPEIGFASWMLFAAPFCLVLLLVAWRWLDHCYSPDKSVTMPVDSFREQLDDMGTMSREEKIVAVVFTTMALLWLSRADLRLGAVTIPGWAGLFGNPKLFNDGTVAIAMTLVLFIAPARDGGRVLDWETVKRLPWDILLLFGGGFALAKGFVDSGLSQWFAEAMAGAADLPLLLIIALIALLITFLTELTSNTATSQVFLPLLAALAVTMEVPPPLIMVPATFACSFAFMLPVATPPNAIVFGSGKLTVRDMMRAGLVLNLVGTIAVTLYTYFVGPVLLP